MMIAPQRRGGAELRNRGLEMNHLLSRMQMIRFALPMLTCVLLLSGCGPYHRGISCSTPWHVDPKSRERPVRIHISGQVKHPGNYAFPTDPSLSEVINRASGFTDLAYLSRIQITSGHGTTNECDYRQVQQNPTKDVLLHNEDQVIVKKIAPL